MLTTSGLWHFQGKCISCMHLADASFWKGISLLWGSKGSKAIAPRAAGQTAEDDPHTIHIFTVASGHMYERLQKIMVLSVLRKTK